jgi:hypothetical protein
MVSLCFIAAVCSTAKRHKDGIWFTCATVVQMSNNNDRNKVIKVIALLNVAESDI